MADEPVMPADVAGLVSRLTTIADMIHLGERITWGVDSGIMREAATALEGQAAELAMWREVKHSSPRLEIIEAELTAERAAHAETRRERDEHKRLKNELVLKAYRAMDGADDLVEVLKRYGFPVSDAAEPALMEGGSREAQALHKAAKAFTAARDALELENERLRKDAERYRLLRRGNIDDLAVVRGLGTRDYGSNVVLHTYSKEIDGDELDNAIDDARRALEGGE